MTDVNDPMSWGEEFASPMEGKPIPQAAASVGAGIGGAVPLQAEFAFVGGGESNAGNQLEDWKHNMVEFAKGLAEMSVEFGKACRDVVKQNVLTKDSFFMKKFGAPCAKICKKLSFLNEYLPEDRDPAHAWAVIFFVFLIALAVLKVDSGYDTTTPSVKKLSMHPPSASKILLPDGRRLAYQEQGVPAGVARFSLICPHSFLSSRLAGIPGMKDSLLQEFGVRLVTYDLPGFGESDPHHKRNLESSSLDILHLSYAVGVTHKFWIVGYSGGSMHAWAALRYIPDRVAGAIMVAPMINPYEPRLNKEERRKIWGKWTAQRKLMFILARRFPRLLSYFYVRSFLSGEHGRVDEWLSLSLSPRDKALVEEPRFDNFWQRDIEESVRQGNIKPFMEEAVLQVSDWGFGLIDLKVKKNHEGKGIMFWLKSIYGRAEEQLTGFLGPIHIWQGMDDCVFPPSMTNFVQRVIPGVMVHKLLYDGHFTYFYFCDECHRQIFTTIFGNPQGPLATEVDQTAVLEDGEGTEGEMPQCDSANLK